MAHVDGFEHDIFISYAHVDDSSVAGEGWVTAFAKRLQLALERRIGRPNSVNIWRDKRRLEGNHVFDNVIEDAVKDSAVFVALTSFGYHNSEYCQDELSSFHKKASAEPAGLDVEGRRRIFNVRLYNIPFPEWLEEFGGTTGFPFFVTDDDEDEEDEGVPTPSEDSLFEKQLRRLVKAIFATLEHFQEQAGSASTNGAAPSTAGPSDFTVFLADVPGTRVLRKQKKRIINDLEREGITVVSEAPPPYAAAEHDRQVIDALQEVELSVHLLDLYPDDNKIEGMEDKTYPRRQLELASEHARSQIIWVPQEEDDEEEELDDLEKEHREFLLKLERGEMDAQDANFIRCPRTEITFNILEKIKILKERKSVSEAATEAKSALLVTKYQDMRHVLDVADVLEQNNIKPLINQEDEEPEAMLAVFKDRLKKVSSLIIFFGKNVKREWVATRLETAIQTAVLERGTRNLAVYVPPPRPPTEANFSEGFIQVKVLDGIDKTLTFLGIT